MGEYEKSGQSQQQSGSQQGVGQTARVCEGMTHWNSELYQRPDNFVDGKGYTDDKASDLIGIGQVANFTPAAEIGKQL